jgi:hypothetical protein
VPCVASERPSHASPPCNAVYGLPARQQREGLLLLLRITSRPIPSVDAYEAPAAGTVPYPSTVLWALSAAASCVVGSACGGLPHTTPGLPGGLAVDEGSELRKVHNSTLKCTSCYPYPASFARLKHWSQSLPRITNTSDCFWVVVGLTLLVCSVCTHDR